MQHQHPTKIKEAEHTPSPQPARGIYGFIFCGIFVIFIIGYALWIILPVDIINSWPYQPPQKYWAVATPIFFCTCLFVFAFFIYPSLHILNDPELTDLSSITDRFALARVKTTHPLHMTRIQRRNTLRGLSLKLNRGNTKDTQVEKLRETPIPTASDINIEDVSRLLYLTDYEDD